MTKIDWRNVTASEALDALHRYNTGFYAKARRKNIDVERSARDLFVDGLGRTVERVLGEPTLPRPILSLRGRVNRADLRKQVNRLRTELPRMTRIDANGAQGLQSPDPPAPTTRTM